jgi:hypothetical protein
MPGNAHGRYGLPSDTLIEQTNGVAGTFVAELVTDKQSDFTSDIPGRAGADVPRLIQRTAWQ